MAFTNKTCATAVIAILIAAMSVLPGCGDESPVIVTKGVDEPVARTMAPGSNESQVITVENIEDSGTSVENAGGTQATSEDTGGIPDPPTGGTAQPEDQLSPIERDAQHYAERYGVELSEAVTRLTLQEPIGELDAALTANESDTFVGLWIQHEPDYRVVAAFTEDGERTIAKYVQDGPLLGIIEVRTAGATLRELQRAQREAGWIVAGLGFQPASGINVKENRVEVYAPDRARLEKALRDNGKTLPDHVVIIGQ